MLVLSRRLQESIVIDGEVVVTILGIRGGHVKIGIEAPMEVPVHRKEVFDRCEECCRERGRVGTVVSCR